MHSNDRAWVATRKVLFELRRQGTNWNLHNSSFLGEPVTMLLPPDDRGRMLAALNLGHFGVKLHASPDAGATWQEVASPTAEDQNIQDAHRIQRCAAQPDVLWCQHHGGIWRSTDNAANWHEVKAQPSSFGFALAVHPEDGNTAWFVPAVKDERRVPVDGAMVVNRTRDGGQTFDTLRRGLPQHNAFDLVYRHGLDVAADGQTLIMGSTTGNLWASGDGGDSWQTVSSHLPPIATVRLG